MLRALKGSGRASGLLKSLLGPEQQLGSLKRFISSSPVHRHERLHEVLPPLESFARRHIGPSENEVSEMLGVCGVKVITVHHLAIMAS